MVPANLTRVQALVLAFFVVAWISLVVLLIAAPETYDRALGAQDGAALVRIGFLVALSAFLVVLGFGVVHRWRWMFWLLLVAFVAGILRVPAGAAEIIGLIAPTGPTWYVLFQMLIGVVQFAIALAMLAGYRRGGTWSDF